MVDEPPLLPVPVGPGLVTEPDPLGLVPVPLGGRIPVPLGGILLVSVAGGLLPVPDGTRLDEMFELPVTKGRAEGDDGHATAPEAKATATIGKADANFIL